MDPSSSPTSRNIAPGEPPALVLSGGRVLTEAGWQERPLIVAGGMIRSSEDAPPEGAVEALEVTDCAVVPGFVDLQVNGGWGLDFTERPDSIWEVGSRLPRHGVTSFLPTLVSPTPETVTHAQTVVKRGPPADYRGASVLGLHIEGPLISEVMRGAHPLERLRLPGQVSVGSWRRDGGIRLATIAPELPRALQVIARLVEQGVVVSLGHSAASFEEATDGILAGAGSITHLYNAMSPLTHRAPGMVGAGLTHPDLAAGLIVDGIHVHSAAVRVAWRARGPQGIALVTDAMAATGIGESTHRLAGTEVLVRNVASRTLEGRLAGSTLTMDAAVRNLMAFTGCPLEEAIEAAATTPARLLGEELGVLRPGTTADVLVLDSEFRIVATLVGGRIVFREHPNSAAAG